MDTPRICSACRDGHSPGFLVTCVKCGLPQHLSCMLFTRACSYSGCASRAFAYSPEASFAVELERKCDLESSRCFTLFLMCFVPTVIIGTVLTQWIEIEPYLSLAAFWVYLGLAGLVMLHSAFLSRVECWFSPERAEIYERMNYLGLPVGRRVTRVVDGSTFVLLRDYQKLLRPAIAWTSDCEGTAKGQDIRLMRILSGQIVSADCMALYVRHFDRLKLPLLVPTSALRYSYVRDLYSK
jgi:hypothetical protein